MIDSLKPMPDRIMVEIIPAEMVNTTLVIPVMGLQKVKNDTEIEIVCARIISCGDYDLEKYQKFNPGDLVLMSEFAGTYVAMEDHYVKLVHPDMIFAFTKTPKIYKKEFMPAGNRVLVKIKMGESLTKSGLILQGDYLKNKRDSQLFIASVLALGEKVPARSLVKVGSEILFEPFAGQDLYKEIPKIVENKKLSTEYIYRTVYYNDIEAVITR
jgi:co-chaperonin GroES (HSP10)